MVCGRRPLCGLQDIRAVYLKGPGQHDELYDVDPAFAAFDPRHERLMAAQPQRQLGLRQPGPRPRLDQRRAESGLSSAPGRLPMPQILTNSGVIHLMIHSSRSAVPRALP